MLRFCLGSLVLAVLGKKKSVQDFISMGNKTTDWTVLFTPVWFLSIPLSLFRFVFYMTLVLHLLILVYFV